MNTSVAPPAIRRSVHRVRCWLSGRKPTDRFPSRSISAGRPLVVPGLHDEPVADSHHEDVGHDERLWAARRAPVILELSDDDLRIFGGMQPHVLSRSTFRPFSVSVLTASDAGGNRPRRSLAIVHTRSADETMKRSPVVDPLGKQPSPGGWGWVGQAEKHPREDVTVVV